MSERIKQRRLELGLTLEEVGDMVGVSKSTVLKWENGDIANMRRDKIASLASALRVSPAYLMGWTEEEEFWNNVVNPTPTITDKDIRLALWNGEDGMTDEQYEEIMNFANYIKTRNKK